MAENENVRWTCNIRSDFTENLIEYDKTHNPYTGYKLRVSYRDGVYVSKSKTKYREYLNEIRDYFENTDEKSALTAEILYSIAQMRKEEKDVRKAAELLEKARVMLCDVMKTEFSQDSLSLMKKINGLYYSVSDNAEYNVCDLYMLLKKYGGVTLCCSGENYSVTADGKTVVFCGNEYDSVDAFIENASIADRFIYSIADLITVKV